MSRLATTEEPLGHLAIVATTNGTARYSTYIVDAATRLPIGGDLLNLTNETLRDAFAEKHIPVELREEGKRKLLIVAARIDAERNRPATVKADKNAPTAPSDEPWEQGVDGRALLNSLQVHLARYVVVSAHGCVAAVLWIVHTYLIGVADYTPYLLLTSPVRECGKSTLLEMLLWLAHRAQLTGGITAAALYRRIDRSAPAMLLDELDTRLRGDGGDALKGVLNTGFHRSGKVTICVGDDHDEKDFGTFCPKVLAGIGRVWDTVTSRSIPIRMARAEKAELKQLSRIRGDLIADECAPFRRQLLRWSSDNQESLRSANPDVPEALGARQADVWRPLLAIADAIGGEWPTLAREAAVKLHSATDDEGDYGLLMLQDVRTIMGANDAVFTETLLKELTAMDHRPWSEYGRLEKPITARGVASLLGRFSVKPGTVRISEVTAKGYTLGKLAPAFLRYLPTPSDPSVTSVTTAEDCESVTDVTHQKQGIKGEIICDGVITSPDGSQRLTPEREADELARRREKRAARGGA